MGGLMGGPGGYGRAGLDRSLGRGILRRGGLGPDILGRCILRSRIFRRRIFRSRILGRRILRRRGGLSGGTGDRRMLPAVLRDRSMFHILIIIHKQRRSFYAD